MTNTIVDGGDRTTSGPADQLRLEVLRSFAEVAPIRDEWDAFVERVGSDVYFTIDWLEAWWKYYGSDRQLRLFLIREQGRMVAVLPFCVEMLWVGPLPARVARLVGSDSTISVLSPPVEPPFEGAVITLILNELLIKEPCDAVSFSPLSGASSIAETASAICRDHFAFQLARNEAIAPHVMFRLPESFEQYLKALQKQQRANYVRDFAQLSKRFQISHTVIDGQRAAEHFDQFVRMHDAQWHAVGRLGHFGDWPKSMAFNADLVRKLAEENRVRLYMLAANGEPISIQYTLVFGNTACWRLPARVAKSELEKFGLGRIGLIKMIEALIAEGVRTIEAGPGHYDYKTRHGGIELPLRRLVIARSSLLSGWKVRAALLWADVLNKIYYKAWFLKVATRSPRLQHPLWNKWIRTRL